jgi:predicted MFS family arabinose efflux permease
VAVLYVDSRVGLFITIALVGSVGQLYRPAAAALLVELTPDERQVMVFAMYRLALNIGTSIAPLLGALLIAASYDMLFWGEALASLAYVAIALTALPRSRKPGDAPSQLAASGPALSAGTGPGAKRGGMAGYRAVLADRRFVAYIFALFVNSAVYVQYLSTLPLAVTAAGLSTMWYSIMVTINGGVVICCELMMTKLTQHHSIRKIMMIGFPLLGCGMAVYSIPAGITVFVVGTLLWSLSEIVEGPIMFAYPGRAAPKDVTGRYVASAQAMFGLGQSIGPMIGVLLWSTLGPATWLIMGVAALLGLIPALWGVTPKAEAGRHAVAEGS